MKNFAKTLVAVAFTAGLSTSAFATPVNLAGPESPNLQTVINSLYTNCTVANCSSVSAAPDVNLNQASEGGVFTMFEGKELARYGMKASRYVGERMADVHSEHPQIIANLARALAGDTFTAEAEMNGVYQRMFGDHRPARTTIQAAALPSDGLRVEIDCIAYRP